MTGAAAFVAAVEALQQRPLPPVATLPEPVAPRPAQAVRVRELARRALAGKGS